MATKPKRDQPPLYHHGLRFVGGPLDGLWGRASGIDGAHFPARVLGPDGIVYRFGITHDRIVYTVQEP